MGNVYTPIMNLPIATQLNGFEWVPIVKGGTTERAQAGAIAAAGIVGNFPAAIEFVTGSLGSIVNTGKVGWLTVPFPCTIASAILLGDITGSIVMDVWKTNYAGYPTVGSSNSITGGNPPTISTGVQSTNSLLGWTTSLSSGDILVFNVNSVTSFSEVTLSLGVARSLI